ncbi:FliM/FliN family flagellar motor C-terminal domain-containing protein [Massilia sp. erpn]|uniref:FliM/FliN family flagellar motor C-terminal domain-containing protein n=1 Tax=Massilia sp. erpn TaxID=2738142 RepID=UPI002105A215|nr:FliM/FliN family flagellar motor C-terminal domain-containing protein [Massilia sp. erpn]UTY59311.1 FliM/FliN family flagellar motor switch protein [Massilia sp. erpn]
MAYRPYRLLGKSTLAAVQEVVQGALAAWCADWGLAAADWSLDCQAAADGAGSWPLWRQRRVSGALALWYGWGEDLPFQLQKQLFPPERSYAQPSESQAGLAAAGAAAALAALLDTLAGLAHLPGAPAATEAESGPGAELAPGSGAVCAVLRSARCTLHCVLNGAVADAWCALARQPPATAAPLAPLAALQYSAVLAHVPLSLPVAVGRASVSLGNLRTLAPGDVIRLDSLADRPLAVGAPQGGILFAGYLGLAQQSVALEVLPAQA